MGLKFKSYINEKEKTLQFHDDLNDKIWDKKKEGVYVLKEEVRKKLLEIADAWVEYAKIPEKYIRNVLFTGSLANFNFTTLSDVDLHILLDYEKIDTDFDLLYDYFKDKKALWAENHNITIKGYPVELYAQPMTEKPHTNQGVYSVSSNKWIQEPKRVEIDIDNDIVFKKKLKTYMEQIDDIIEGKGTVKSIEDFREKIRKMRGAAIAKSGEFSQENLIFKSLRNKGYLEKLSNYHHELLDKKLSLEKHEISPIDKVKMINERANRLIGEAIEQGQEEPTKNFNVNDRVAFKIKNLKELNFLRNKLKGTRLEGIYDSYNQHLREEGCIYLGIGNLTGFMRCIEKDEKWYKENGYTLYDIKILGNITDKSINEGVEQGQKEPLDVKEKFAVLINNEKELLKLKEMLKGKINKDYLENRFFVFKKYGLENYNVWDFGRKKEERTIFVTFYNDKIDYVINDKNGLKFLKTEGFKKVKLNNIEIVKKKKKKEVEEVAESLLKRAENLLTDAIEQGQREAIDIDKKVFVKVTTVDELDYVVNALKRYRKLAKKDYDEIVIKLQKKPMYINISGYSIKEETTVDRLMYNSKPEFYVKHGFKFIDEPVKTLSFEKIEAKVDDEEEEKEEE